MTFPFVAQSLMQRRTFLFSPLALVACASVPRAPVSSTGRRLAITMDDPSVADNTPLLDPRSRDSYILHTLAARKLHAGLFVCGMRVDSPAGAALLARWSASGHVLGNHSYAHRFFHSAKMSLADFVTDLDRGESLVRPYPGFRRLFRFPFLKEGDTLEKRDGARAALLARGYTNGHVTIDASDWAFDARLAQRMRRDSAADLSPFRAAYVTHMLDRARYYDSLAHNLVGRSIAHTMLVHHSLLNALFLSDLLNALERDGWSFVDADEAYADPVFLRMPTGVPAGESLIWALAKESPALANGLRYPGEDEEYEKDVLNRLEPEPPSATP